MFILAFDVETTGLSPNCQVLTAYFVLLDKDLNEIDKLDLKIKHDNYVIQPKALEINGIDIEEHEKTAITVKDAIYEFEYFLMNNNVGKVVPMGHNVAFDIRMLKSNKILSERIEKMFSKEKIDTQLIAKELKNKNLLDSKQSVSLGKLCEYYDIKTETENLHDAEYDIKLTIQLYKVFKEMEKTN